MARIRMEARSEQSTSITTTAEYVCDKFTNPDQVCKTILRHIDKGETIQIWRDPEPLDPNKAGGL